MNNLKTALNIAMSGGWSAKYNEGLVMVSSASLNEVVIMDEKVWEKVRHLNELYKATFQDVTDKVLSKLFNQE